MECSTKIYSTVPRCVLSMYTKYLWMSFLFCKTSSAFWMQQCSTITDKCLEKCARAFLLVRLHVRKNLQNMEKNNNGLLKPRMLFWNNCSLHAFWAQFLPQQFLAKRIEWREVLLWHLLWCIQEKSARLLTLVFKFWG